MKRPLFALALTALLLTTPAQAAVLTLDGSPLDVGHAPVYENTTYVSLRAVAQALRPDAAIDWEQDRAVVRDQELVLTAQPGDDALILNGVRLSLACPVRLEEGRTLVPVRTLAAALGAETNWCPVTNQVSLTTASSPVSWVTEDNVYWLSRIISAESQGESWIGKLAVGNVVLNRVNSPDFPDTIYGVIFDDRWGGQFEPVRNGTVYKEPTAESVQAALACLAGENPIGGSLYFLAPHLTENHWTMENRTYVTTIGAHWFYQ